ncbi:hypothetical protein [Flavobacterium daemonense]|uniref:hypothetical protein n=1 Tax=Flavobacterium daemonense TaxID=1393049 RepID=UPI001185E8AB|nr:hypothetical protein [Flavobacterium daemonense]KAF2337237.1 hypothetical protein FND99_02150 [Flavobacterium daemonense]
MKLSQVTERIYKTKNDIPYIKLLAFGKEVKGRETDIDFIEQMVKKYFNTSDMVKFHKALETDPKRIKFRYKFVVDLSIINDYIDAEIFQGENDIEALLRMFVKPNHRFEKVDVHKISYAEAEHILKSFSPAY